MGPEDSGPDSPISYLALAMSHWDQGRFIPDRRPPERLETTEMAPPRVLSVRQCGFDHASISSRLRLAFGAEVLAAATHADALDRLRAGGFDLVLVNRVSDADGSSGLDLIRRIKADDALRPVPVMLVSNHADAQTQAAAAGAEPGFGKAALGQAAVLDRVRPFLA